MMKFHNVFVCPTLNHIHSFVQPIPTMYSTHKQVFLAIKKIYVPFKANDEITEVCKRAYKNLYNNDYIQYRYHCFTVLVNISLCLIYKLYHKYLHKEKKHV